MTKDTGAIIMQKTDFLLNEALTMSPSERARLAHCLISSLEEPANSNVDEQWIKLAEKRLEELEKGDVKSVSWEDVKKKIKE